MENSSYRTSEAWLGDSHIADLEKIRLLECVVENFPGGLLLFDRNLRLVLYNAALQELLDYPDWFLKREPLLLEDIFWFNAKRGEYGHGQPEHIVKARMDLVRRGVDHVYERTRPNGTVLMVKGRPLAGGGFVTTYIDVSEQHRIRQDFAYLAMHDSNTGLPNRNSLDTSLPDFIKRSRSGKFAVLFLDLDKFKPVNDRYGHDIGDKLLKQVAVRLRMSLRESDIVCRYGGDEFVVLQNNIQSRTDIDTIVTRLLENILEPFKIDDFVIHIGVSIGVALYPDDGQSLNTLIERADIAMYKCKSESQACVYSSDLVPVLGEPVLA